jgi:hypothetical protein
MKLYRIQFELWRIPLMTCGNGPERVAELDIFIKGRSVNEAIPRAETRAASLLAEGIEARVSGGSELPGDVEEVKRKLYER